MKTEKALKKLIRYMARLATAIKSEFTRFRKGEA